MASSKNIEKLNDSNYLVWTVRVDDQLTIKDCNGAVTDPFASISLQW